jgi:large subunit ribosomal protein L9
MQVLLWQNVSSLGKRGEIVNVADGHAYNYLFPQKLAVQHTPANLKLFENEKKRFVKDAGKAKDILKALGQKIEQVTCTLEMRANKEGVLFGSVTPQIIMEALQREGINGLDPVMIELETPIKELGVYRILIKLDPEVQVHGKFWVVEESNAEEAD